MYNPKLLTWWDLVCGRLQQENVPRESCSQMGFLSVRRVLTIIISILLMRHRLD
jgi:hypothetical protein